MRFELIIHGSLLAALAQLPVACTDDGNDDASDEADTHTDAHESESTDSTDGESDSTGSTDTDTETDSTDSTETETDSTDGTETETDSTEAETDSTDGALTCAELEAEYDGLVAMTQCNGDTDCKIVEGHCGVGIGGCFHAVNLSVDPAQLAAIAQTYSNQGCTSGVCDCPATPESAACVDGFCEPVP